MSRECFSCDQPIPPSPGEGVLACPACGAEHLLCPSCGAMAPAAGSFCGSCRASLRSETPAAEQKASPISPRMPEAIRSAAAEPRAGAQPWMAELDKLLGAPSSVEAVSRTPAQAVPAPVVPPVRQVARPLTPALPRVEPPDVAPVVPSPAMPPAGLSGLLSRTPAAPVPARSTGLGAVPSMMAGLGPSATPSVLMERAWDTLRVGAVGAVRLRATSLAADGPLDLIVHVTGVSAPFVGHHSRTLRLPPGVPLELEPISITPQRGGQIALVVSVLAVAPDGVQQGRWAGHLILEVEQERQQNVSGTGHSIYIMGDDPLAALDRQERLGTWELVELASDISQDARANRPGVGRPTREWSSLTGWVPEPGAGASGRLIVENAGAHVPHVIAVCVGSGASIGRGGDPGVRWWADPAPFDPTAMARLSRRHAEFLLARGAAWITDCSSNGVELSGMRIPKGRAMRLSEGDSVVLAGVIPIEVSVHTAPHGAVGLTLARSGSLHERLSYLMTSNSALVRLVEHDDPARIVWFGLAHPVGEQPGNVPTDPTPIVGQGDSFIALSDDRAAVFGRTRIRWESMSTTIDQSVLLSVQSNRKVTS